MADQEPPSLEEVEDTEVSLDDAKEDGGDLEAEMFGADDGEAEAEAEAEAEVEVEVEQSGDDAPAAAPPAAEEPAPEPAAAEEPAPEPEAAEEPAPAPPAAKAPAAAASAPAAAASPKAAAAPKKAGSRYTFTIKVGDPERIGSGGVGSYIVYSVTAKTNMPEYKTPEMTVSRRFTDFYNLQKMLQTTNPGVIVPPCPPKDAVQKGKGIFKSTDTANDAFTEKRARALQRFLKRVVAHPDLINDPLVHQFLETDEKMPAPKKDLITMLSLKMAPVEVDEWFDDKTRELSVLDNQLKKLHSAAQLLCEGRKDLSHHTDRFSKSFAALAQVEELKQLTSAMHRLADVEAKVHRLHSNQARRDMFDFSEIIFDYISLVGSCKVALVQRGEKLKRSQEADTNMTRKQETEQKLKGAPATKPEKLTEATNNVQDAERKAKEALAAYVEIARKVKQELERFDVLKIRDFTHTCIQYVKEIMNMEQLIIKEWEAFLPEAKAIVV